MIIDAHTHTYPETIAKRAIEKLEKNSGTKAHTNGVQSGLMASMKERSEERRVGKECRSRWSPYH